MAAVAPTLTATFDSTTGLVTTTWTSTDQRDIKISFTRTAPRRETEPSYGTERYKGQFQDSVDAGDPQAHLVHGIGPELDELVWDGDGETSGTICTGTWRVAMYYINTRNERSSTATTSVTVSGVPCAGETEDEEDEDEPAVVAAPTITSPTDTAPGVHQVFNGTNVLLTWTVPSDQVQTEYKAAVYRNVDINPNTNEPINDSVRPLYGSIRTEDHRDHSIRSHWVVGGETRITFSDTSYNANAQIPTGTYVVRLRYRNQLGRAGTSAVAVARFEVQNVDPPAPTDVTPDEPDVGITPGSGGNILLDLRKSGLVPTPQRLGAGNWLGDGLSNLTLFWSVVFESGLPQGSYRVERRSFYSVSQQPQQQVIEYFTGETASTIWSSTDQEVDSASQFAVLRGNPPTTTTTDPTRKAQYWWLYQAGLTVTENSETRNYQPFVQFRVTAYDTAGNAVTSDWTTLVNCEGPYPILQVVRQLVTVDGRTIQSYEITADNSQGATGVQIEEVKLALYDYQNNTEGMILAGTVLQLGGALDAPGAHWVDKRLLETFSDNSATVRLTPSQYFSDVPHELENGANRPLLMAIDIRDTLNRRASAAQTRNTRTIQWGPRDAFRNALLPLRLTDMSGGVPTVAPPLTGLAEGIGIALIYHTLPQDARFNRTSPNDIEIWRREFSRNDAQPVNTEPRLVLVWADRRFQRPFPAFYFGQEGTSPWWFFDFTAADGVQYEYQLRTIDRRTGGRFIHPWVP